MTARRFTATVDASGRDRVVVPVPFDPDQIWGVKPRHHITGTVNGRSSLGSGDRVIPRRTALGRSGITGLGDRVSAAAKSATELGGGLADVVKDVELRAGQVLYLTWERDNGAELDELWVPYDRGAEWLFRSTIGNQEERAVGGEFPDSALF